jgi:hypothetical protein
VKALKGAVNFFYKYAGYGYTPGKETKSQGRWAGARKLAHAEYMAKQKGWKVEWQNDDEPYEMGDAETEMPNEVLGAVLKDENGEQLASLWGIGDPSNAYRRVVEAELALEAL